MSSEQSPSSPTVLVTGATGYVGGRLIPRLLERGCEVRCFVRDAAGLHSVPWREEVSIVEGDALAADTLPPAVENVDAIYYLIHSLGAGEGTFAERDRRAASNVRRAAEDAGVDRLIYLGGMRPKGERQSKHLQSRIETGRVLREGSVPVIEFRAAQIVGSGSLSFELVRYLTERVPVMICPRWVDTPTQPIAIDTVLDYLTGALDVSLQGNEIVEIGGADILTYADMFKTYARLRGLKRWIVNVPFLTPRLSSHWIGVVTPLPNTVARPLIEGLDNEVVVDDPSTAQALFPDVDPIGFEEAVRLALRRPDSEHLPTVWTRSTPSQSTERRRYTDKVEGLYREVRQITVDAPPDVAFDTIGDLGGESGWPSGTLLWRLRGWVDRLLGGPGFRKERPSRASLREGDMVDFWRVAAVEPGRLLRLRAEMKLPGRAWLQFEVKPDPDRSSGTLITQSEFFEPKGLFGVTYWGIIRPLHNRVFSRLLSGLVNRIEQEHTLRSTSASDASPTSESRTARVAEDE